MQFIDLTLGTPFPEFLPSDLIVKAIESLHANGRLNKFLGYGAYISGDLDLRKQIIQLRQEYTDLSHDDILITFGSTDAIDLFFRSTLEHGDVVVVEDPTYKWAIKDIVRCGARVVPVPVDADGMQVELLEEMLRDDKSLAARLKSVYTIPTFHNPTGVSMSGHRRRLLLKLSKIYDFLILEDDPYYELSYQNEPPGSLLEIDEDKKQVVQICTFSKLIAPGLRLGWLITKNPVISEICSRKHNASNPFLSAVVTEVLKNDDYPAHLKYCRDYYRLSLEIFNNIIENQDRGFRYFIPGGGFYVFLTLPAGVSENVFIKRCADLGVKLMAGSDFFYSGTDSATIRLSFASVSHDDLTTACNALNNVLKTMLNEGKKTEIQTIAG